MLCEIHREALRVLVSGAVPLIIVAPDGDLHLFTIVPADEVALEAFYGPSRGKAIVGASAAIMASMEDD